MTNFVGISLTPWYLFFFFNDTATTDIYTLSLHDALPIWRADAGAIGSPFWNTVRSERLVPEGGLREVWRSEEHTSELQSQFHLVCRLLLEKKKFNDIVIFGDRTP